ncbi:MAG: hypothetical protein Q9202_003003 [Teloschistes flavicans]
MGDIQRIKGDGDLLEMYKDLERIQKDVQGKKKDPKPDGARLKSLIAEFKEKEGALVSQAEKKKLLHDTKYQSVASTSTRPINYTKYEPVAYSAGPVRSYKPQFTNTTKKK